MGSVRVRRETNRLFFDFRYRGVRCREMTALADTPDNRKKMERVLEKIEAEITLGTFDYTRYFPNGKYVELFAQGDGNQADSDSPTFAAFVEQWFDEIKVTYRESHRVTIRTHIDKHLEPFFGSMTVAAIKKPDVLTFRAHLASLPGRGRETLSASAINHILSTLNMIMSEAAERYEFGNPCVGLKRFRVPKSHVDPFNMGEVRMILDAVRSDFRNYYTVRFFTGMRTAEIHGLKWQYVDFNRREILIRETLVQGRPEQAKTDGSERAIQMSQPVYDALRDQYQATGKLSEYVFCARNGAPLSNNNVTKRVWYPLLRHLGLKRRRPYQTRHTAATLWLAAGENPEWIARQMGHSSTEMLFRVYSRFVPNLTRRDGTAFEGLLAQQGFTAPPDSGVRKSASEPSTHYEANEVRR